jgi:hypothetical protein
MFSEDWGAKNGAESDRHENARGSGWSNPSPFSRFAVAVIWMKSILEIK